MSRDQPSQWPESVVAYVRRMHEVKDSDVRYDLVLELGNLVFTLVTEDFNLTPKE